MLNQEIIRAQIEQYEGNQDQFVVQSLRNTAAALVEDAVKVHEGQRVLLWFDSPGTQLVQELNLRCLAKGAEIKYFARDVENDAKQLADMTAEQVAGLFEAEKELIGWAETVIIVRDDQADRYLEGIPRELRDEYEVGYKDTHLRRLISPEDGGVNWCLFLWPTELEAAKEGIPYDEYFRQYMEACNQPWGAIKEAQKILKQKLDGGERLQLIANENDPDPRKRTNITMSIKGMTFCNSTIDRNYPGSEVFSAPVLDSVNGQIYADGEYMFNGRLMKNIHLKIENGVIIEAMAEEENENLQVILGNGPGARKFGEVALGTNPGLIRRFFNDLLNEKVGGSFHMAIGHCYEYTHYGDDEVHVNNGNTEKETPNHWDLTILMHRRADGTGGGKVILDGEVIQEDGIFVDPRLKVLNPKFP